MAKAKKTEYPNARIETLHKTAQGLARIGALDKKTMRAFDTFCLTKVEVMSGDEIQALRQREGVSQAVLAGFLNVAVNTVSQWERGERRPTGAALKLLHVVRTRGLDAVR